MSLRLLLHSLFAALFAAVFSVRVAAGPLADKPVPWTDEKRSEARATWEERIPGIVEDFRAWNESFAGGRAYSERTDSAVLAWRQSRILRRYLQAYHITGDLYWLDTFAEQVDRMLDNRERHPPENRPGWATARGVALLESEPLGPDQKSILNPPHLRVRALADKGRAVTGHTYRAAFDEAGRITVTDLDEDRVLETADFDPPHELTSIPGGAFLVEGEAVPGEGFRIETVAPREIQLLLHDGMITHPIALFVELVLAADSGDPAARHRDRARGYLEVLEDAVFLKWEPYWKDLPGGKGNYRASDDPTERFPGYLIPHNRYMTIGRTWLALRDVPGGEHSDVLEDRIRRMTAYFKGHVRSAGGAWAWNFWDPGEGEEIEIRRLEDMSHAAVTASYLVQAHYRGRAGVSTGDLEALANTFVGVMWNGSLHRPRFEPYVARPPVYDSRSPELQRFGRGEEWHELARFDHRVWRLLEAAWNEAPGSDLALDLAYTYTRILEDSPAPEGGG